MWYGISAAACFLLALCAWGVGSMIANDAQGELPPHGIEGVLSGDTIIGPYGEPWLVGWVQVGAKKRSPEHNWTYDVLHEEVLGGGRLTLESQTGTSTLELTQPLDQLRDYTIDEREETDVSRLRLSASNFPQFGHGYVVRTLALKPGEQVLLEDSRPGEPAKVWRGGIQAQADRIAASNELGKRLTTLLRGLALLLGLLGCGLGWMWSALD